jgi:tetratricopeptide (TPR) repeat protein
MSDATDSLTLGRRYQAAGRHDQAIAAFRKAAADASVAASATERLILAMRQVAVSEAAIREARDALGQLLDEYAGFEALDPVIFGESVATARLAEGFLLGNGVPANHDALDALVDIIEESELDLERLISLPALGEALPRLYVMAAERSLAAGNPAEALRQAMAALDIAPCYGPAYRCRAEAFVAQGDVFSAAANFDRAAALGHPGWWRLRFTAGTVARVPGLTVDGFDIYFVDHAFRAVLVNRRWRHARRLLYRSVRKFYRAVLRSMALHGRAESALRLWIARRIDTVSHGLERQFPELAERMRAAHIAARRFADRIGAAMVWLGCRISALRRYRSPQMPRREPRRLREIVAMKFATFELWALASSVELDAGTLPELLDRLERSGRTPH